ncbi:MAG: hypothetical protein E5X72_14205 [Mesorhizobium sp.]|uniref:hypothetical protein n=1 Tax=Mesorhizobium sp. TaxID=1871066 RepID=UPI00122AB75C|nr:hypothetical protein [Mesorhizobium sp.]TIP03856.1 MAG: hypothetical protein E5X72_14205 [Mesorhizobium sp.]
MTTIDPRQTKARDIVDGAIRQLCEMGMTTDGAASLLCTQGFIRIGDQTKRQRTAATVADFAEPPIDE